MPFDNRPKHNAVNFLENTYKGHQEVDILVCL